MHFTKLKTLNKEENKSKWQIQQPKFEQMYFTAIDNPWKQRDSAIKKHFPDYRPGNYNREKNIYHSTKKTEMAKQIFYNH